MLLDRLDLLHVAEAVPGELVQYRGHQFLGHRGPAGHSDRGHAVQPALVDFPGVVDQVGGRGTVALGHLDQPDRVRGVRRAHHDHQVGLAGDDLDRGLPVLRGVADVVARRVEQGREALTQRVDGLDRLVHRQRRLGQPDHLGRVPDLDLRGAVGAVDQADPGRGLAGRPHYFLVSLVADQQDVVVLGREPPRLVVHLGYQRAGRVDGAQVPALRVAADIGGDAVRGEHHDRAGRHLVYFRHKDGATPLERAHDVGIVHDLPAHVDRGAEPVQRHLDRLHSAVDPGAVASRLGEQDPPFRSA